MAGLDDLSSSKDLDSGDFVSHLERFPRQLAEGMQLGMHADNLPSVTDWAGIAVLGVGGSGISGDILQGVLEPQSPAFVSSVKGYELPRWVGPKTLVFAVSYSGTTEETIHASALAAERGAPTIVIASGGPLAAGALPGSCVVRLPPGLPPRAALGYLVMPMLGICARLGLCRIEQDMAETLDLLEERAHEYRREMPAAGNRAKQLAQELIGTVPIIYGSEGVGKTAAYRWKCQFNECSKVLSYSNAFPELDHNELEVWGEAAQTTSLPLTVIALRHGADTGRNGARIDLTLSMIQGKAKNVKQVVARGASPLARLFDLIYLGDFTAAYLGLAQDVDPGRIRAIPALKAQMDQTND